MTPTECPICFELSPNYIRCSNQNCITPICINCMETYLTFSIKENEIPKCNGCSCYYIKSNFNKSTHLLEKYNRCCLLELVNKYGDDVKKRVDVKSRIEMLRNERKVFLNTKFPAVIAYTAINVMPKKLKRLDKQITSKIEESTKKSYRICMNLACNGLLDSDFVCGKCVTKFCQDCERVFEKNHECKSEDLESIQSLKGLIKCPNCKVPILKEQGCNNMTCAKCGQKFDYSNGEKSEHGSEHVNVLNLKDTDRLLTIEFHEFLTQHDLVDLITELEELVPTNNDKPISTINKSISRYFENNEINDDILNDILATQFDKVIKAKNYANQYHKMIRMIEHNIINNSLDSNMIDECLFKLKKMI